MLRKSILITVSLLMFISTSALAGGIETYDFKPPELDACGHIHSDKPVDFIVVDTDIDTLLADSDTLIEHIMYMANNGLTYLVTDDGFILNKWDESFEFFIPFNDNDLNSANESVKSHLIDNLLLHEPEAPACKIDEIVNKTFFDADVMTRDYNRFINNITNSKNQIILDAMRGPCGVCGATEYYDEYFVDYVDYEKHKPNVSVCYFGTAEIWYVCSICERCGDNKSTKVDHSTDYRYYMYDCH